MIKKLLLVLTLVLGSSGLLTGCGNDPFYSSDDPQYIYKPDRATHQADSVHVTMVFYPNLTALRQAAKERGLENWRQIRGFATWTLPFNGTCTIHMVSIDVKYDPATLGHEMTHCLRGNWHD